MSLGERCDEIVRLIDETLVSVAADSGAGADPTTPPGDARLLDRGTRPAPTMTGRRRRGPRV